MRGLELLDHSRQELNFRWAHRKISDAERMLAAVEGTAGKRLFYRSPNWLKLQNA